MNAGQGNVTPMPGVKQRKSEVLAEPVFEDPPEKDPLVVVLRTLVDHPNRWAKVMWFAGRTTAYSRAKRLAKDCPVEGDWDFDSAEVDDDDGGSWLYARYLSEPEPTEP